MANLLMWLGALVGLIGWLWLIVVAFKTSGALWGVINIFLQPFTGLIFCIVKKVGWSQFGLMLVGWIICIIGIVMSGKFTGSYSIG